MQVLLQQCCRPRSAASWIVLLLHQYAIMIERVTPRRQRIYTVCCSALITTFQSSKAQHIDISTPHDLYSVTSQQCTKAGKSSQKPIAFMRLWRRCMLLPNIQCCPIQRRVWPLIWHSIGGLHTNCTGSNFSHKAQRHLCGMPLLL